MKDLIAWNEKLEKHTISAHGVKTAIFVTPNGTGVSDEPITLFVHGVNGSHEGMTPLAFEVSHKLRPIFVELPGHGDSEVPEFVDIENLKLWFQDVYKWIKKKFGQPAQIIAHSFGCYVITGIDKFAQSRTILLSPVPTVSRAYLEMDEIGRKILGFKWATRLYNNFALSYLRGLKILRVRSRRNVAIVRYLSTLNSRVTPKQRQYQADVARISSMSGMFDGFTPGVVVMGLDDKVPSQRTEESMRRIFPNSKIIALPGGHFSHMDHLDEVAELLLTR